MKTKIFLLFGVVCLLAGCASFHKNPPLTKNYTQDPTGYSFNNFLAAGNEIGDNFVVVATPAPTPLKPMAPSTAVPAAAGGLGAALVIEDYGGGGGAVRAS